MKGINIVMKKLVIVLVIIVIMLAVLLLLKITGSISTNSNEISNSTVPVSSTYSNEDIEKLILKGQETLSKVENAYYEKHTEYDYMTYYHKNPREKIEIYLKPSPFTTVKEITKKRTYLTNLDANIEYTYNHDMKTRDSDKAVSIDISFQSILTSLLNSPSYQTEFIYVKDEELEGKDCIFVKAFRYDKKTGELKVNRDGLIDSYWIEKSTGFFVGASKIHPEGNSSIPTVVIRNLSFGTVKDSDFAEPEL